MAVCSIIADNYVDFVISKYAEDAVIIFHGYPENITETSTKFIEHDRLSRKKQFNEIVFNELL